MIRELVRQASDQPLLHRLRLRQRHRAAARWLMGFAGVLLAVQGAPASSSTLVSALEAALTHSTATVTAEDLAAVPHASSWLSSVPTLSASFIDSQQALGTDETEVSLNLPIKSAARRRLDAELARGAASYGDASADYRRWLLAGRLREAVWAHRLASVTLAAARERRHLLAELSDRLAALAASGVAPRYAALITARSLIDAELAVDAAERALAREAERFLLLTGEAVLPETIEEAPITRGAPDWPVHPAIRQLELSRAQQRSQLALAAPDTSSWNVSLVARNFEGPQFSEEQYGLAVEVPLNFLGTQSEGNRSERSAAMREYLIARDQLWLDLRERWNTLTTEMERLERQRQLLGRAVDLANQIELQISALEASNEIEAEVRLQRLLDVVDTRAALMRTEALIGRNNSRLQQAAGRVF